MTRQLKMSPSPDDRDHLVLIHDAATAALATCKNCDIGFRRAHGIHVGSQRLGMIDDIPCDRVFAARGEGTDTARPWLAYVDGAPLHKHSGEERHFASAKAAYAAARKASPRQWHQ